MAEAEAAGAARTWTLLTGHGHVLVTIAKNPAARVRDIAADAGLTERATQAIITDLEEAGYISRRRVGRRTEYTIHTGRGFRHSNQDGLEIGPFLELLAGYEPDGGEPAPQGVRFSCTWRPDGDQVVLAAAGELDHDVADRLWTEIAHHMTGPVHMVLDCSGITFCDSAGVQVLMHALKRAEAEQATFALAGADGPLARTLQLAGLDGQLPVVDQHHLGPGHPNRTGG